ncbi:MAG: hypothetical protein ABIG61_14705 [Planctomycetota bacterium]
MIIQKVVKLAMEVFEQKMEDFAGKADTRELTADLALDFSAALKDAFSQAGRKAYQRFIESYDIGQPILEVNDQKLRWKMASPKDFLTPFGTMQITRSLYQADAGGKSYCPLDDFWGMKDEFATEDVRQAIAFSMAHLTADETEQLFEKCAWFHPSATAIKNVTNNIGDFVETHADTIMQSVQDSQQLPQETDVLVAGMDGVNVLLREQGAQQGRPAQRPGLEASSSENTAYKNAMAGAISCYALPSGQEERPQRLQSCYVARMPQQRAVIFKQQFEQELLAAEEKLPQGTTKIFLCDGHRSIWSYADSHSMYDDYEKLIDFYHTTEHLSKAGEALFGKSSNLGDAWYNKYRKKLLEDEDGAESVLRSMTYYSQNLRQSKGRQEKLEAERTFFRRNKERMSYADFIARGLPIGSGPVEAACKSIVKTRLCRSGMRWSRQGGQRILHLRCFVKSNRWDVFWKQYIQLKRAA